MSPKIALEALSVDNGWARFVVFLFADPHLLEGGEGSQDGSSNPYGVFPFWWSDDLDLHGGWGEGGDLLLHTVSDTGEHGRTSGQDGVGVQVLTDIDIALHDGVVGGLVDTSRFHTDEGGLEEGLGASESLVANGDDLSVGQFVGFLQARAAGSGLHFLFEVEGDVGEFLLDVTDDFTFGGGGERVATFGQDFHHVVCEVTSSQIQTDDGVGKGVSFVDWDGVGDTISGVEDDTGGTTRSVQGEDSLDGDVHGGGVEGFEHDLCHLFSVGFGVKWGLGQENGVFLGGDTELIVESMMPDLLHIIPVGDNSVFDGVLQGQDTSLALSFVSDVRILLSHTDHDTLVTGSSDNGWEDSPWGIISGEPGFAHTGTIVHDQSCYIFVSHLGLLVRRSRR